ncbi:MAG: Smr/MutS family protein [Pyrinomonadaceae bacterium MAG19_C2-C3]|nr:Smr/MutS family protein [Pyrinomonadaceae bacterium MAG19_C2-C3]
MRHFITYFRRFVEARDLFSSRVVEDDSANDDEAIPEFVRLEITDAIDLHSFAPRDIPTVVAAYLEAAHGHGFRVVRIIHGKGKGVQRAVVSRVLAQTPFVASFTDAPPNSGGWGATMVRLIPSSSQIENQRPTSRGTDDQY